jgi:hypothetical protein
MNEWQLHNFFQRRELECHKPAVNNEFDIMQDARFDGFIKSKSGHSFGFYIVEDFVYGNDRNWDSVVWVPRSMIEDGRVKVKRFNGGFEVSMPLWFANQKGVL